MDIEEYKIQKYLDEQNWDEEDKKYWEKIEKEVKENMGTIREEAIAYEPKLTLNIADLDKVAIDELSLSGGEGTDKEGNPFHYKYAIIDGKQYRVPSSVLEELQKMLKLKPELKFINVSKTGSGLATKYSVEEYTEQ